MKVYTEEGATIRGEIIIGKARKITLVKRPIMDSGRHRAQSVILKKNAECIIQKAYRKPTRSQSNC